MSAFLIVYDRKRGRLRDLTDYGDDLALAEAERLRLELASTGQDLEILVLEAKSRVQLESTHARYFGQDALELLSHSGHQSAHQQG